MRSVPGGGAQVAAPAQLVAGRYRLTGRAAVGGMGEIWRAVDERLGRPVAVKLLREELAADEEFRRRFRGEARAAASITHPGVVPVYDYGQDTAADGGALAYLVMEFVQGRSLAEALAAGGPLSAEDMLPVVRQVAVALQAAHDGGVVHRDIKPGNLLLTPDGTVKVTDFGIARASDAAPLTRTGMMLGTAQFISPEQARGERAGPASDLYSLGIVAYTCLAGAPPFNCGPPAAIALAHLQDAPPPLPGDVPAAVRALVSRLLAKDPGDRPASAAALVQELDDLRAGRPAAVSPPAGPAARTLAGWRMPAVAQGMRLRRLAVAAAAAAVLLAGVAAALAIPGSPASTVPAVTGKPLATALVLLDRAGLEPAVRTADIPRTAAGTVVAETPAAGITLPPRGRVTLTVATGTVRVAQTLLGQSYSQAERILRALGLRTTEDTRATSTRSPGTVLGIAPSGEVLVNATVVLTVAASPVDLQHAGQVQHTVIVSPPQASTEPDKPAPAQPKKPTPAKPKKPTPAKPKKPTPAKPPKAASPH